MPNNIGSSEQVENDSESVHGIENDESFDSCLDQTIREISDLDQATNSHNKKHYN